MNKIKRIGIACLGIFCMNVWPVQAATTTPHPFEDLKGSFAEEAVSFLYQKGFVSGVSPHSFGPQLTMNRKHFTVLLAQALGVQPVLPAKPTFQDVPADSIEYGYVEAVHRLGLMNGISPQQFGANHPITRQDAAVILHQAFGDQDKPHQGGTLHYKDQAQIKPYAQKAVQFVTTTGMMTGSGDSFYPNKSITRAESAVLCKKVVEKMNERAASPEWVVVPGQITLKSGESNEIKLQPANGPIPFLPSWGFDHSDIGSITADGLFTAKQPGTGVITLNIGTKTYQIKVEVQKGEQTP